MVVVAELVVIIFLLALIQEISLVRRDRVAGVPVEEAVLLLLFLAEATVLWSRVHELSQNAAEAPHVDLLVVTGFGQYDLWSAEISRLDLYC